MESSQEIRINLSCDGLIQAVKDEFLKIMEHRTNPTISLSDALMSAFAMFSLKNASLLEFEIEKTKNQNLKNIYKIDQISSDTQMREIIDGIETKKLRKAFKLLFSFLQRGKVLESYRVLNDYYILSGQASCQLFRKALGTFHAKKYFWQQVRSLFNTFEFNSMEELLRAIAFGFCSSLIR